MLRFFTFLQVAAEKEELPILAASLPLNLARKTYKYIITQNALGDDLWNVRGS